MTFSYAVLSETGPRTANEDCIGVWPLPSERLGLAIADGLGGHSGRSFASKFAVDQFGHAIQTDDNLDLPSIARTIHFELVARQEQRPEWGEMATTFSAAIISQALLVGIHCGDTRIVVTRGNGIKRLTEDHTEVQRLLLAGKLTAEQAADYPRKNILDSALGIKGALRVDPIRFDLRIGDRLFLTSDGVHSKILLRELKEISARCDSPEGVVDAVGNELRRRGPEDNYSLVCCFIS